MLKLGDRLLAALVILGSAVLFAVVGISLSNADESKVPDLSDLRDAVATAGKRGENVGEIRKALDALEKSLAKGWTAPAPGKTIDPPAELVALRDAVEAAAKKGENVEEIRKQLDIVEKAITGKVQTKPKPIPPTVPLPPDVPYQLPFDGPQRPRRPLPQPVFPGAGVDREAIQNAQDQMKKAAEMLLKNPDDPEAMKLMHQAQEMLLKAMIGGRGGIDPGMIGPGLGGRNPDFGGRIPERFRLGVRLERVSELAADQLGLDVARGVGIADVVAGSAAEKAGFKTHDIVLEFAGKPVSDNPEDFTRQVSEVKVGAKVDALVMRKGKKVEIKGIELPDAPRAINRPNQFEGLGLPLPDFRPVPDLAVPGGVNLEPRLQVGNSVSYSAINGQLIIKAVQDNVIYVIQGQRNGDETEVSRIVITDGTKMFDAEKLDKVPEKYRPVVERLLKGGQGRAGRP
jgi:serine protease Do